MSPKTGVILAVCISQSVAPQEGISAMRLHLVLGASTCAQGLSSNRPGGSHHYVM